MINKHHRQFAHSNELEIRFQQEGQRKADSQQAKTEDWTAAKYLSHLIHRGLK